MDKELTQLINETVQQFFDNAPMKMVEKGSRTVTYDICPHCKKEIFEKHEYTEDGGVTWRHSDCHGLIDREQLPIDNFSDWLRPFIQKVRDERSAARKPLDIKSSE